MRLPLVSLVTVLALCACRSDRRHASTSDGGVRDRDGDVRPDGYACIEELGVELDKPSVERGGDKSTNDIVVDRVFGTDVVTVESHAFVEGSLDGVMAALRRTDVVADPLADESSETQVPAGACDGAFGVMSTREDIITVMWRTEWRAQTLRYASGERVGFARYEKAWGTAFLQTYDGTIVAIENGDGFVELFFTQRIEATEAFVGPDAENTKAWARSIHAKVRDAV